METFWSTFWGFVVLIGFGTMWVLGKRKVRANEAKHAAWMEKNGILAELGSWLVTAESFVTPGVEHPIAGLRAEVEDSGTVNRRLTVTRMATFGVASVALPKKIDDRDVYVTVTGPGVSVMQVFHLKQNPDAGVTARTFAGTLNATAMARENH